MKPTTPCAHPDGCSRPSAIRGWCRAHYFRWRTTGDLGPATFAIRQLGRICAVDDCDREQQTRGWCPKHYKRWQAHGDPTKVAGRGPGITGEANDAWVGGDVSYAGIHTRLRRQRGLASAHSCEHCGKHAKDWAYNHADPNEKTQEWRGYLVTYSGDVSFYTPLCGSCHRQLDMRAAANRKAAA